MANRAPDRTPRPLTCKDLRELASAYLPILQFSRNERYFPLQVESWLGHATGADWEPGKPAWHADDLAGDVHRRGTTLMEESSDSTLVQLAGPPGPGNRPLLLPGTSQVTPLDAWRNATGEVFLSFAGWLDDARRTGDPDYLYKAFSEQAAAMNAGNRWEPFDLEPNRPVLWVPQPVSPTVYAEVQLASAHVDLDRALHGATGDFPAEEGGSRFGDLDDLLCVTYHYFFALADHAPGGTIPPRREGQWETASIYFPVVRAGGTLQFSEPPSRIVLTRGRDGELHVREPLRWAGVAVVPAGGDGTEAAPGANGTQPVVFVGEGTHHLFIDPSGAHPPAPEVPPLGFTLGGGMDAGSRFWLTIAFLFWALAALAWGIAAIAALLAALAVAAFFAWAFLILVALFLIIAALVALFGGDDPSTNAQPPTQEADPEGPTAGDTSEPAGSGAAPGSGGSTDPGADAGGEPSGGNPGSPIGRNTVPFDLRVIDLVNPAGASTPFPPDALCEHPAWWNYAGRWGVRVTPSSAMQWTHGDRRIDEQGRTLAYWNSARLAAAIDADG